MKRPMNVPNNPSSMKLPRWLYMVSPAFLGGLACLALAAALLFAPLPFAPGARPLPFAFGAAGFAAAYWGSRKAFPGQPGSVWFYELLLVGVGCRIYLSYFPVNQ